jgi:hypothetical protein
MREIPEIKDVQLVFGEIAHMPKYEEIPKEFKQHGNKWCKLFSTMFYGRKHGAISMIPKEGVDPEKAGRALRAIMVSWEPKHEHKEAGVAFLMSEWFEDWKEDAEEVAS